MRHVILSSIVAAFAVMAAPLAANAQSLPGQPSAERGEQLVNKLCAVCHIQKPGGPILQGKADVPTFPEIARIEGQSRERIIGAIVLPAHPMPQIMVNRQEMSDIAAYILSLKKSD